MPTWQPPPKPPRRWGSANTQPPYLGPGPPLWPRLRHLVRVGSLAFTENGYSVYNANIMQWTPTAGLRPREAVYVTEANRAGLLPGFIYKGRIIGAYPPPERGGSLPLIGLSTACCGTPPVASSSPSSVSAASPSSAVPSSASPSRSSSSPGPILSPCCQGVVFPAVLHVTMNFFTPNVAALTYDRANNWWAGSVVVQGGATTIYFRFLCVPNGVNCNNFNLLYSCDNVNFLVAFQDAVCTCSPLFYQANTTTGVPPGCPFVTTIEFVVTL